MAATKQKSIQLKPKRDELIAHWCLLVKDKWNGGISYLVKYAIREYIKTNTFPCIGKVHLVDDPSMFEKQPTISLWLGDSPDLLAWADSFAGSGIAPATMMREIIRQSITVVSPSEEEWIPSCLDFQSSIFDKFHAFQMSKQKTSDSSINETNVSPHPKADDNDPIMDAPKAEHKSEPFKEPEPHKSTHRPRAAGLSGKRFSPK